MAEFRRQEKLFHPGSSYGEPHEENDSFDVESFYFELTATGKDSSSRLSGYISREEFNWLAKLLGTPPLEEVDPTPWCAGCGAMKKANCDCGPIAENN